MSYRFDTLLFIVFLLVIGVFALSTDDSYDRQLRIQEWRDKFVLSCMPRKGDIITAQWVEGSLVCRRITPSPRYGETFPHVEIKVGRLEDIP